MIFKLSFFSSCVILFLNASIGVNVMVENMVKMNETNTTEKWRDYCNGILFGMVLV